MTRRHVITGGSGFVGTRLAQALVAANKDVVVFDLTPPAQPLAGVAYIRGDIANVEDVRKIELAETDTVYHLAARQFHGGVPRTGRDAWFNAVNVEGTHVLLTQMATVGARRLIFFSTDMTYGRPSRTPVTPTHPQNPVGPYGRSKLSAEALIATSRAADGLNATIFRPRLIAGAGRLGILAKLFSLIRAGAPVPMIGSGANRYQMISVDDCVSAALRADALGCPPGPFNLGSEDPPTVRDLLTNLIASAGSSSRVLPTPAVAVQATLSILDRVGLTLLYPEQFAIADIDYVLDTQTTSAELDWQPAHTDDEILFAAFAAAVGARTLR